MKTLFFLLAFTTFAAAADVRTIEVATGELLVHPFTSGVPLPAESKWTVCQGAGPSFVPENGKHRLSWDVILKARSPGQLRGVGRATVQEVSGATAIPLFDGAPKATEQGGLVIVAPAQIVSRESYPWLYAPGPTLLIFRVILFKGTEQDKLLQPVLIGAEIKRKLRDGGYLP
jgi:hypothetical protein